MKIAHFGTFDVENFGDLLFPLVLERRLADLNCAFVHASPRGGAAVWRDCIPTVAIETLLEDYAGVTGVIIGGGHLVHASPTTLEAYNRGGISAVTAYLSLWAGAAYLAQRSHARLCWNAPSVAQPFSAAGAQLARWTASLTDYLAVRDPMSEVWLRDAGVAIPIHVVPDTALEVSKLWSEREIHTAYAEAFTFRSREVPPRAIAFHLNDRFTGPDLASLAERLDRICQHQTATAILVATGPCHGDSELQRIVGGKMKTRPLVVDQPRSLREIVACIACSEAYIGSSLHGFITACSYGKRAMIVIPKTNAPSTRVTGFLDLFSLSRWHVESWEQAENSSNALFAAPVTTWRWPIERGLPLLDAHWARIHSACTSQSPALRSPENNAIPPALPSAQILCGPAAEVFLPVVVEQATRSVSVLRSAEYAETKLSKVVATLQTTEEQLAASLADLENERHVQRKVQQMADDLSGKLAAADSALEQSERSKRTLEAEIQRLTPAASQIKELLDQTREINDILAYERIKRGIGKALQKSVPRNASVLVVSRGDDELLELSEHTAWHFLQESDGTYAGRNPADSEEIIQELERLASRGANYLVLPVTASWWLEHYADFATYLNERCQLVAQDPDACRIYGLAASVQEQRHARQTPGALAVDAELITLRQENQRLAHDRRNLSAALDATFSKWVGGRDDVARLSLQHSGEVPPCLLTIVHVGEGGTMFTTDDLLREVSHEFRSLLLTTGVHHWSLLEYCNGVAKPIREYRFGEPWRYDRPLSKDRMDALRDVCLSFGVVLVHVRHLIGNGACAIHHFKSSGIAVVFSFHDFYTVCPTVHLLDDTGTYCGGRCTSSSGECTLTPVFFGPPSPALKHRFVYQHREGIGAALRVCDSFVTTSQSAKEVLVRAFPFLLEAPLHVIEHGRLLNRLSLATPPRSDVRAKVVCLGNLDHAKGTGLIREIMELDAIEGSRFEFHFVGRLGREFDPIALGGIPHGEFKRSELAEIIGRIRPSFFLVASICSETYSHTLTEGWGMGIPVFVSNLGAIKERVKRHGGGWVLDHTDSGRWYRGMLGVLDNPKDYAEQVAKARAVPIRSAAEMAGDYLRIYRHVLKETRWLKGCFDRIAALDATFTAVLERPRSSEPQPLTTTEVQLYRKPGPATQEATQVSKAITYARTIKEVRDLVEIHIPPGAKVSIVSKGDDELTRMGTRPVQHFPANETGGYLGHHPASSTEARGYLAAQVRRGAEFLVFPQTAFWWLEHYREFRQHLDDTHERILGGEHCVIYRLSGAASNGWLSGLLRKFLQRSRRAQPAAIAWSQDASKRLEPPSYSELVSTIHRIIDWLLPRESAIVVVSKGDDELVSFPRHRGWHFPQTEHGAYAGHHPARDDDAINALEELRKKGGNFLMLPATAFWWLAHYRGFAAHLRRNYSQVWQDKNCTVFDLSPRFLRTSACRAKGWAIQLRCALQSRGGRRNGHLSQQVPVIAPPNEPRAYRRTASPPLGHQPAQTSSALGAATGPLESPVANPFNPRLVTVIVPVFNAFEDTRLCIDSLLLHGRHAHEILIIDDCSSDSRVWPTLLSFARLHDHIRVLRHTSNKGFTATVNEGCRLARGDVVLLNSDCQVTKDWLEKLAACAASAEDIGTVTALSNAAGAFSVPQNHQVNSIPADLTIDDVALLLETLSTRCRPRVPTGNGFCLYIKRRVLNAVGFFDEVNFPRGYGEENEFCLRAGAKGFQHAIDDATYIHHKQSASFGDERTELMASGGAALHRLYPQYSQLIAGWLANDPIDALRGRLEKALESGKRALPSLRQRDTRPTVLAIVHDGAGGTLLMAEDLIRVLAPDYRCLLLKTGVDYWTLFELFDDELKSIRRYAFSLRWSLRQSFDVQRQAVLREICGRWNVEIAHIHHLIGNGPAMIGLLKSLNLRVLFSFHDFYTLCPTIQLIDNEGTFCGGTCTIGEGKCDLAPNLFPGETLPPTVKHDYVYKHRAEIGDSLRQCDCFAVPSESARAVLIKGHGFLQNAPLHVVEHGRDLASRSLAVAPNPQTRAKVLCFGNVDYAKGAGLIHAIMDLDAAQGSHFEFHFVGNKSREFHPEAHGGIYHGPYQRCTLAGIVENIGPSFAMIASICSETFCYTLSESWAMGLPVFASDLGALKERVEKHGGGWLLNHRDPKQWYQRMRKVLADPPAYSEQLARVAKIPIRSVTEMGDVYLGMYHELQRTALHFEGASRADCELTL